MIGDASATPVLGLPPGACEPRYAPIRDYAAIGDCHGAALVSATGSIDWCCLERLDNDPVFCRILDAERGGFLSVLPELRFSARRRYIEDTNVLSTVVSTGGGTVTITDFMPVGRRPGAGTHDYVHLAAPGWTIRIIEGNSGTVPLTIRYRPSIAFARAPASLHCAPGWVAADGGPCLYHDMPDFAARDGVAVAAIEVRAGERRTLVVTPRPVANTNPVARADRLLKVTLAFWREWIAYCRYRGPYKQAVRRSALALKLLTYAPTGAIAAAASTSLPEALGGSRNWDYRFCWLRDSALTLYALAAIGYGGEAREFSRFLQQACAATYPDLQIMYGIGAEADLAERSLDHLDGYMGSRPVRTGNGAYRQRQIDVYGEILDWALLFHTLGGRFDRGSRRMLAAFADFVAANWNEPDQGLWEMRGAPRHNIHSKMMSWVALDRAIRLIGSRPRWLEESRKIVAEVRQHGIDPLAGHLVQSYDQPDLDAALLLAPTLGFPLDRATLEATVRAIERDLRQGDLVYRYRGEDGLTGSEGAFLICSFWLVDALLRLGRRDDATALFRNLLARANDVGLYAEEVDPGSGDFLGNFPQAFTHLALIGAAVHLDLRERRGPAALAGNHADRARLGVRATLGWHAWWAAFRASCRLGRIRSSRRSVLADDLRA
ncbi:MAG: glycoside hydrolase family 15 protein [Rhodospirillales bacterium]|nr:glycoside hydrolase family 15 protein [Rhodospirillales bacterium]